MDNFILAVEFDDGRKVFYDVKEDIDTLPTFRALKEVYGLFNQVQLDSSRTCVYWNAEIDLASDSIYDYEGDRSVACFILIRQKLPLSTQKFGKFKKKLQLWRVFGALCLPDNL